LLIKLKGFPLAELSNQKPEGHILDFSEKCQFSVLAKVIKFSQ
jgi:hypothetical protein